ncbi:hypothetical protein LOK49_LG12G02961 [Camellia lanceoleosa]|uniref:Uncharacterized protein n=1 Tax=Camellia lanceoleosa TaxID=1840588 RepID=A0ACC0FWP9_9ERIC|nr:hypothetical protein LOK49_LG12G02961 [Camellia lanceoleosa]
MAPQSWKEEIFEAIDLDILSQVLNLGKLDMDYLGKILDFVLITLQKLSAPAKEDELKALKQKISNARIKIMQSLLKGPAGLEYVKNAFAKRHGPPSDASTALPLTMRWLSSVWDSKDQEWHEHTNALLELTRSNESSSQRLLPSTTLRTGGSSIVKTSGSQLTSVPSTSKNATDLNRGIESFRLSTLATKLGVRNIAFLGSGLLLLNYIVAILAAVFMPQVFKRSLMISAHTILALSLIFQARLLEKANYTKKIISHMKRRNGISLHQEIESIRMGSGQIELQVMDTGRILIQS